MATQSNPYQQKVLGLQEQKAFAQKLRESGMDMPQGQTVSGWYVAPSWSQYLAKGLQTYLGATGEKEAKQGLEDLYAGREAERKAYVASMPTERVTPDSKVIQPTLKDYADWATKGAQDFPTEAGMGLKLGEMQQAQAAKAAELAAAREERLGQREWQAGMQRQRMLDMAAMKEANTRLAAELRPAPQPASPVAVIGPDGKPTYVPKAEAVGKTPYSPTGAKTWTYDSNSDTWVQPPSEEFPAGQTTPSAAKIGALKNIDYLTQQFVGTPSNAAKGITQSVPGLLDQAEQGGFMGVSGKLGYVSNYQAAKEFDNKREQLSTEMRKIFRIPGEGALSDKEQALYGLQLPSRDFDKATNARILQDLQLRAVNAVNPMGAQMPTMPGAVPEFDPSAVRVKK